MAGQSHPLNGGKGDESLPTARHKGDRVSTASLGSSTKNSPRRNSLLQRHSKENRHAEGHARSSPSLRHQPGSRCDPLPSCRATGWRIRRLPLGHRAQRAVAGAGEGGRSLERLCGIASGSSYRGPCRQRMVAEKRRLHERPGWLAQWGYNDSQGGQAPQYCFPGRL